MYSKSSERSPRCGRTDGALSRGNHGDLSVLWGGMMMCPHRQCSRGTEGSGWLFSELMGLCYGIWEHPETSMGVCGVGSCCGIRMGLMGMGGFIPKGLQGALGQAAERAALIEQRLEEC